MAEEQSEYLLGDTSGEIQRLTIQHGIFKHGMKGKMVYAPIDLSKPNLSILDPACADGTLPLLHHPYSGLYLKPMTNIFRTLAPRYLRSTHATLPPRRRRSHAAILPQDLSAQHRAHPTRLHPPLAF